MNKRSPRLLFSEEEIAVPKLKKPIKKADKKKPPSKLAHPMVAVPGEMVLAAVHRNMRENEQDNVGLESAHKLVATAEGGARLAQNSYHSHQLKLHRNTSRAESKAEKANLNALQKEAQQQNPQFSSNPYSRWQQKKGIRKEYAAAKAGSGTNKTVKASEITAKAAKKATEETKKAGEFIARHKKGFLIAVAIAVLAVFLLNIVSSCSVLFQGGASGIAISTYPCEDADMLAAEAQYLGMEAELQEYLDTYESTHDYNEYHFNLDDIEHDPYVLISAITALYGGEWMIGEVDGILQTLFNKQYILTETVTTETRYRTETRIGSYTYTDPDTGESATAGYEYDVQVPYNYYICTVNLENFNLSHVPVYIMSQDQLSMYAMYMATLGNRPDLFASSVYVGKYYGSKYEDYEIPPKALEDKQFAAMMTEAEKYLGFPYVWGGSSPSTSFDCSGFVSWVVNNCGVGWNVGRLSASGLLGTCTRVSSANVRPGDLIFFQGTYNTPGASHVGIYVGGGMMIHCGDPIQYANINTNYWQSHFLSFGRLP